MTQGSATTSKETVIPKTVVQKVSPASPSYGDIPGTASHLIRQADAVPDAIIQDPDPCETSSPDPNIPNILDKSSIPKTVVTKVDSIPSFGEVPGTAAFNKRKVDADPDEVEKTVDIHSKLKFILGNFSASD